MKYINISDIINIPDRKHIIESNFDKNGLDICIEYPAIFRSAKVLRDFIIDIADFFQLENTWKTRFTLIADELNNNAIEYGSRENDINKMIIKVVIKNKKVNFILEVEDTGKGDKSKTACQMEAIQKEKENYLFNHHKSIRGRGLFLIISKIVDTLYFRDSETGGLIVGIEKKVNLQK